MKPVQVIVILVLIILCYIVLVLSSIPTNLVLPIQIFLAFLLIALAKQLQIEM